ncbi:WcaF family extracellular polysaccharide biosynthesis acetyltransferase [Bradyrhizobium sp. Gha]|uniref:WcaF family extracellular polysaccharide biosynthesis acetyltransferase n=1 Tax=Bradyrhizobium sp. Gha TaxID=1855318 RepID=UPI0008E83792|nr:WcaF family extracellular polysaccharide biosynthesis acetyltransferase [Bradyrhizobium sp. Gha]SFI08653.1 putative colanic acid biosynthesis acetyltransferase WcaF [Bradyrhizobium sp. Gha]
MPDKARVQDLSSFTNPPGFRGRSAFFVQLWWIAEALLVRPTPQIFFAWRRFILRLFGAKVGPGVLIRPSVRIVYPWKVSIGANSWIGDDVNLYSLGEIEIGHDVVVSQGTYVCTGSHDHNKANFDIFARPIVIEPEAWIAAECFLAPGVRIGRGAVVQARAVVMRDVAPLTIVGGHPASVIGSRGPASEE